MVPGEATRRTGRQPWVYREARQLGGLGEGLPVDVSLPAVARGADLARGEERFAKAVERLGLTRGIAGLAVDASAAVMPTAWLVVRRADGRILGAQNTASRRLLERQGFRITGPLPDTDDVRYTLSIS
jgi:hypothetical protein